jgi:hypothetical protein
MGGVTEDQWMSMPEDGELIADAFNTPVFFLWLQWSQGFLPHFSPPNDNPPIILVALIEHLRHFVVLGLKDPLCFSFPYHRGLEHWRKSAKPVALDWEKKYAVCIAFGEDDDVA